MALAKRSHNCMFKTQTVVFLVIMLGFTGICKPQDAVTFNQGGTQDTAYYTEIPYEWVQNKIIVQVEIQGKAKRFIWDTGAPLLISDRLATEIHIDTLAVKKVSDVNNQNDSLYMIKVDGITIGRVGFDGTPGLIVKEDNLLLRCFNVDGYIGSNLTRNSVVHFDSQRQVIVLTNDVRRLDIDGSYRIPLIVDSIQSLPLIDVRPARRASERVLFDSGDDGFYSMSEYSYALFAKKRRRDIRLKTEGFGSVQIGLHGKGADSKRHRVLLPSLKIGSVEFTHVSTTTQDGSNTRIGAGLLDYGNVTLDGVNKHFYFTPHDRGGKQITYRKRKKEWSISPTIHENRLVVGSIWGTHDLGVTVGDRILKINDTDVSQLEVCDLILGNLLDTAENHAYLTVQLANGTTKEVKITAEE